MFRAFSTIAAPKKLPQQIRVKHAVVVKLGMRTARALRQGIVNSDTQITVAFSSSTSAATGSHGITATGPGGTSNAAPEVTVAVTLLSFTFTSGVNYNRDCAGSSTPITLPTWPAPTTDSSGNLLACPQRTDLGYAGDHAVLAAGSQMIGYVVFDVSPPPTQATPVVAQGSSSAGSFAGNASVPANSRTSQIPIIVNGPTLPVSETSFYNPLSVSWSIGQGGGVLSLGTSSNPVYVTLGSSVLPSWAAPVMLTYASLAVGNGGANSSSEALANTGAQFSTAGSGPANVTTWDGRKMYYYSGGFGVCATTASQVVQNLPTSSAQCGAFAFLLESALAMNGIHSNWIQVNATDGSLMLINSWALDSSPSYPGANPWVYKLILNGCMTCSTDYMDPPPAGGYGDLSSLIGVPGQSTVTPIEKAFNRHFIVQISLASGNQYFDASYGLTYLDEAGFELQSVAGDGNQMDGDSLTGPDYHVRAPSYGAAENITFTPMPTVSM